jgi:hypothetical protein
VETIVAGTVGTTLWWVGLAVLVLVVIPLVLFVALTLLRTVAEIGRYADDIREHGAGLADAVGQATPLGSTPALAADVGAGLARYARAWQGRRGSG